MGNGIIEKLKTEYDIEVIHNGFEIHPDVPQQGIPLKSYFPNANQMFSQLKLFAGAYDLKVNEVSMVPNTNKMLQIGEYAKTVGKSEALNKAVFHSVFVENKNISSIEEIYAICQSVGIHQETVDTVLNSTTYKDMLDEHKLFCRQNNITSVPTFIINDQVAIVGAQSPDNFKKAFLQLKNND